MPNINKGHETATIDCAMIVLTTEEDTPRVIGTDTGTKIAVEADIDQQDGIKLIIKGTLKAQKTEKVTITGHTITLTDNMTILELIEILQGGTLVKDETTGKITSYTPPVSGTAYKPTKFKMEVYSAIYDQADIVGYEKITYPGCEGQPVALGSEDDVFRVTDYTIKSAPGAGQAPYRIDYVEELPTLVDPA